jgi:zinc transport system permease protein
MPDFFLHALLGGIGVALAAGPLGCFVAWKRMAYFGDALAHAALLGVALGIVLHVNLTVAILGITLVFSLIIIGLHSNRNYTMDTMLGILAHSMLAIGLVVMSFMKDVRIDIMSLLFGDILTISGTDIMVIYGGVVLALLWLVAIWRPLLLLTIHADLARIQGMNSTLIQLQFMVLISVLVAVSIKIVGIVLITSLLIIPAAAARPFSRTPEQMAITAAIIGVIAVVGGLYSSLTWDTPSGPSVIVAALLCFIATNSIAALHKNNRSKLPAA